MITLYPHDVENAGPAASSLLRIGKGVAIYYEGDKARRWYEVVSGIVRTCRYHVDGHRQLTGFFYAGDFFGVDKDHYKETAEAVTNVVIRRHGPEASAQGRTDGRGEDTETALRRALTSAQQCIFLLGHRTAAERVAAFLLAAALRLGATKGVPLPMSRNDIADHLGLTIHTVSRTISDLARRQLIALEGPQRFRILDEAGLRDLAGEDPSRAHQDHSLEIPIGPGGYRELA
ncbi:helix-turn-helix domain-containing protein [Allosphingosinicella flava]|uniref:Helix-turn-helix domain-containing protein n=1 Tax=Allosphingosinicella flava TaxID=2771430 RepID=A0A7T2GL40_9SPHN|nr:helix-turn-helix domain-containing protein [Sphingosinicella flava]QPQ55860.1 helix-turn-helix domain-containing protein [Sphingosinicella flava]